MRKNLNTILNKALLVVAIVLLCSLATMAQYVADYKRSADNFYAKGDWYSAAQYYEKYLEQKQKPTASGYEPYTVQGSTAKKKKVAAKSDKDAADNNEIIYRIAEAYRQLNDYGKAEPRYAEATAFDKTKYPLATYYYGVSLRANAKYAEAEKQFDAFLKSYAPKDSYSAQAKVELTNLKFIQEQLAKKDLDLYKVSKLGGAANSVGANYAPTWSNGQLVFTSSRADSSVLNSKNKNPYINNLYQSASSEGVVANVEKLKLATANGFEQGVASFTGDGKRVYFTRWSKKDGKNISAIYLSTKKDTTWGEPVKLGSNVNAEGFSSKDPYVTADGRYLLYASDRDGGMGKFDLWYAPLNNDGEPGSFVNLGKTINTKEDDQAPYYSAAAGTLVFASNGRVGMGGFDLYESKGSLPTAFSEVANLGYPVNSVKDDIYFTNKNGAKILQDAIISTDRSSACCLELFTVNKTYKKYVTGVITDCKTNLPLADAVIKVDDKASNRTVIAAQSTGPDGKYFFELNAFAPLQLAASKAEYNNATVVIDKPVNNDMDTLMNAAVCLVPIEKVVPVADSTPVTKTEPEAKPEEQVALFDFAKYSLRKETGALLDTLAGILKREKSLGLEILGYTDKLGSTEYNLKLSQQRADACKEYLIKQGVPAAKLKSTGKGECCPLQPDEIDGKDNPAGRQANRRVEFKVIFIKQ